MAKIVSSFNFDSKGIRKYPWRLWTNGETWRICQGEDFDVEVETMRTGLHNRARNDGLRVKTSIQVKNSKKYIYFKFWTP